TLRFLDDLINLAAHANPDGMELVSNWYMRHDDPLDRTTGGIPRLYQKYVGHDNNRDSYLVSQPETQNMSRVKFIEWHPQIMYNHHQRGPRGTVLFVPPFRNPFNYNTHPLLNVGIDAVGIAMHNRLIAEGKYGATMRDGASFSTWFNGNVRTTGYFHNMIGILTETAGNPTPGVIEFMPDKQLPSTDLPAPAVPAPLHFRTVIDYSITGNRAILDYASRYRETVLYNRYIMGRDAIRRGSGDSWTHHPKMVEAAKAELVERGAMEGTQGGNAFFGRTVDIEHFDVFRKPEDRDARGYIVPSDQTDFGTATRFIWSLQRSGIRVHRATDDFAVLGKSYPAGSYVLKTDQAFAPHIHDLMEPQDYPNDFQYEGGPPIAPYDNAGYTLAMQMGLEYDRVLEGFDGPFEAIRGLAEFEPGRYLANRTTLEGRLEDLSDGEISRLARHAGVTTSHAANNAAVLTNRLLAAGREVYWLPSDDDGPGDIYIPNADGVMAMLFSATRDLGLSFEGRAEAPRTEAIRVNPVRIGLWDRYGGSMSSGWTRWMLEQYEFPFEVVYPQDLDAGNLRDRFDVLIFPDGAIPAPRGAGGGGFGGFFGSPPDPSTIPGEFRERLGSITPDVTIPALLAFVEAGGTLLAIGSSTNIAYHAELPLTNHLVDGDGRRLSQDRYYIPSSVLDMAVDNTHPLAFGMAGRANVMFNNSAVFRTSPGAHLAGVTPIAWFDSEDPLLSGWAWGQHHLNGGTTVAEAKLGEGRMFLYGPLIKKRAQPHGTFKLLFNGIHLGRAEFVRIGETATSGGRDE
ncbi:MAG: M14 family zinc carboxypeptidase, partial [Gemmatimonadota bacterium]|nr:M14 family zinc carboxypeptidase [Gemmatimonadota bacterium]